MWLGHGSRGDFEGNGGLIRGCAAAGGEFPDAPGKREEHEEADDDGCPGGCLEGGGGEQPCYGAERTDEGRGDEELPEVVVEQGGNGLRDGEVGDDEDDAGELEAEDDAKGDDDGGCRVEGAAAHVVGLAVFPVEGDVEQGAAEEGEEEED